MIKVKLSYFSTAACEKSLACSTCHVILEPKIYDELSEPSDEENDMLDLAFGLQETCWLRLGSFQLTGLKFTPVQITTRLSDPSDRSYERNDRHSPFGNSKCKSLVVCLSIAGSFDF